MNTQKISKENLKSIWDVACPTWKEKLASYASRNTWENYVELSGDEVNEMFEASDVPQTKILLKFLKKEISDITQRVTSYETACKELGVEALVRSPFEKLSIIIKALNQGWKPDWKNKSEYKYYNYYEADSNGNPVFCGCRCGYTTWYYPSALYYKNRELALYGQKIADNEYKNYLLTI